MYFLDFMCAFGQHHLPATAWEKCVLARAMLKTAHAVALGREQCDSGGFARSGQSAKA